MIAGRDADEIILTGAGPDRALVAWRSRVQGTEFGIYECKAALEPGEGQESVNCQILFPTCEKRPKKKIVYPEHSDAKYRGLINCQILRCSQLGATELPRSKMSTFYS